MATKKPTKPRQFYLRKKILELAMETKNGHIGGSLSCIDAIDTIYSIKKDEDKFLLSKGHATLAFYTILREQGFKPDITKLHPDIDIKNGIEISSGSLGHGLPIAVGMALSKKIKNENGIIYVLLGDGECQEGTTWESLLFAAQHNLYNLCIIIDYNKLQAIDYVEDVLDIDSLINKITAFNCTAMPVLDGHNTDSIKNALQNTSNFTVREPKVIILHTIKGSGVNYMENGLEWHNKLPDKKQLKKAMEELS